MRFTFLKDFKEEKLKNCLTFNTYSMPNLIKSFGMSRMTVGSCSDFHVQMNALITKTTPEVLHITEKAPTYQAATNKLSSIVNRRRTLVVTGGLKEWDGVRDRSLGVVSGVSRASQRSNVKAKAEAAILLNALMDSYRNVGDHEYTKETAEVRGLLNECEKEEYKAAIATLGLTEEVEYLREANAAFEEAYRDKAQELGERAEQSDIKTSEALAEANTIYEDIVLTVNAYAVVQPSDEIAAFIQQANGLITAYSNVAGSSTSGSSTTETPDTGEGPAEPEPGEDEGEQGIPHP